MNEDDAFSFASDETFTSTSEPSSPRSHFVEVQRDSISPSPTLPFEQSVATKCEEGPHQESQVAGEKKELFTGGLREGRYMGGLESIGKLGRFSWM